MTDVTSQKGSINVISTPGGAKIQLSHNNSTEQITPETPYTIGDKEPGTYTVTVTKGGDSNSKQVKVEADKTVTVYLTIFNAEVNAVISRIGYYTVAFIMLLAAIAVATYFNFLIPHSNLFRELIFVACAGGLGGLAFNMYVYVYHIGREEDFRVDYKYSYYFRPFLGILYGTFVFFLVAGGLMMLSGTTAPTIENMYVLKSVMFYIALAFLAGYAEEPFSLQLKTLAEALFKEPPDTDTATTPAK